MLARKENIRESYSDEERIAKRKLLAKENRKKTNMRITIVGVAIMSFVLAVSVLYGYATITKMKIDISNLESDRVALETEKEYMIANLEEIKSTSKIEEKAIVKLGMDYPKEDQIVYVDVNKLDVNTAKQDKGFLKSIINSVLGLF